LVVVVFVLVVSVTVVADDKIDKRGIEKRAESKPTACLILGPDSMTTELLCSDDSLLAVPILVVVGAFVMASNISLSYCWILLRFSESTIVVVAAAAVVVVVAAIASFDGRRVNVPL
jgi:hypothetical protein